MKPKRLQQAQAALNKPEVPEVNRSRPPSRPARATPPKVMAKALLILSSLLIAACAETHESPGGAGGAPQGRKLESENSERTAHLPRFWKPPSRLFHV